MKSHTAETELSTHRDAHPSAYATWRSQEEEVAMTTVFPFDTDHSPSLRQVGGKAMSLIHMTKQGLPVPPGIVCSVEFFSPWLSELSKTEEWRALTDASRAELPSLCDRLMARCEELRLDETQERELHQALAQATTGDATELFAVRSSSPEEDLEGASFAGAYETVLGVTRGNLASAIRRAFASAFDARVFLYKEEQGFSRKNPTIAIIIQRQIDSETAGVAFTLNPLNNCYDEVVINASFGQGEAVVSGLVSPDRYVIDKISGEVIEQVAGKKEIAIRLDASGGTWTEHAERTEEEQTLCLDKPALRALTEMLKRVEAYYGKPMDTEWAFSKGTLSLLQARPITAYVPLPEQMITEPGAPKRLYLDMTLSKQGIQKPLTVLGTDWLAWNQRDFMRFMFGRDITGVEGGAAVTTGGRSYVTSNMFKLMGPERQIAAWAQADSRAAEILRTNDLSEYLPAKLPKQLKGAMFGVLKNSMTSIFRMMKAMRNPAKYAEWYRAQEAAAVVELEEIVERQGSLTDFVRDTMQWYIELTNDCTLPMTYAAELARTRIRKLFEGAPEDLRHLSRKLETALPNNVTIDMGIALYELSQHGEIERCRDRSQFATMLTSDEMSPELRAALASYRERFGFRCPMELDIATPRPAEDMSVLFEQLKTMSTSKGSSSDPVALQRRGREEREAAFITLRDHLAQSSRRKAKKFESAYRILEAFGGYREIHKYFLIKVVALTRDRVLSLGRQLVDEGRFVRVEQIFDLTFADLERGLADPSLDLDELSEERACFYRKIQHVTNFPAVIDSRGRILMRPKRAAKPGELEGEAISLGKIRGRVKVLNAPDEKPLHPGEILVARATDPGWTPLFINAAGVVLEVGGLFQHGALVAREYGKPCVAGIENATGVLKDGMEIELDGTDGIIRILTDADDETRRDR